MIQKFTLLLLFIFVMNISAQNSQTDEFGISFNGYVKTDVFFDSRQTVSVRENHFLLYPLAESPDLRNEDVNETPSMNLLSIQSRLTGKITAPDVLGAKVSGLLEGAFFGHSNGDVNGFRLRHAFLKLDWKSTSLLIGQYWHPMFITEVFPGVVSFNTGVPFQPFSRNPQIRITNKFDKIHLSFTAASQRDFASTGPNGTSSQYLRNSSIPILDFNLKYAGENTIAGAGVNYKVLRPYLELNDHKVTDNIASYSAMVFAKVSSGMVTVKLEGVYGTNLTDLLMLGGYAINQMGSAGNIDYTATKTLSGWTDITIGKFGLFAGYSKNMGTEDTNNGTYFSRGNNIEYVWRISPRIIHQIEKVRFAGELEYTTAAYGIPDENGEVQNSSEVSNLRVLLAAYLFF